MTDNIDFLLEKAWQSRESTVLIAGEVRRAVRNRQASKVRG